MNRELPAHRLIHPDGRTFYVYGRLNGTLDGQNPTLSDRSGLHLRHDLLTDAWVAIGPARNTRTGGVAQQSSCPLCPGGPELPFPYDAAVIENRFPTLVPMPSTPHEPGTAPSRGRCEVVIYTDLHDGSMASLSEGDVARVVALWRHRSAELWPDYALVMAFENRGAEVGATLAHPHGQLYAFDSLPLWTKTKLGALQRHRTRADVCACCSLIHADINSNRMIESNESFVVSVPFAARWPFEVRIMAVRHGARRLTDLTDGEARDLAKALQHVVRRLDALYDVELPYMLQVLEAPHGAPDWHLHVEMEPAHRSADRLKVRASVETSQLMFINETVPEQSAAQLRSVVIDPGRWTDIEVPRVS